MSNAIQKLGWENIFQAKVYKFVELICRVEEDDEEVQIIVRMLS